MSKTIQQSTGICAVSVTEMVSRLGNLYLGALLRGTPPSALPAVMLWGMPGVGKSQGVRQLGQWLQCQTGKRVVVTDVRLLLFNPIDLRGIPTADADKQFAIWLRPKIFDMSATNDVVNILFLDEISAAPPSVQAAAYQITLDRTIGEHRLPDNCIVIAAGNRVNDKSVAYKMPKALANRLCHMQIDVDFGAWLDWAEGAGIDGRVIGYLKNRRDVLCTFDPAQDDVAYATPRSWEMVSRVLLQGGYANARDALALIAGCIGEGLATEFCSWCATHAVLPDTEAIADGRQQPVPKSPDALYAAVRLLAVALGNCDNNTRTQRLLRYAFALPPDYTASLIKALLRKGDSVKKSLMQNSEFVHWVALHRSLLGV